LENGWNTAREKEKYREASKRDGNPRGRRNAQNCQRWRGEKRA
jgi:hypothetical protein